MILSGETIRKLQILTPCEERTRFKGVTYGLGPAGYDLRVEFDSHGILDALYVPPGEFVLASTVEHFSMPNHVVGIVHDKSTWARRGLAVQNTVIEPGWNGYLTLEITNHGKELITLPKGVAIAQVLFHVLDQTTEGYEGKYQGQARGPVIAIFEK